MLPRILPREVACPVTRVSPALSGSIGSTDRLAQIRSAFERLGSAQKPAARSAPAYSRFVNRRLGRGLAALAYGFDLSPNAVTAISSLFTFSAIATLALAPLTWLTGIVVSLELLIGYAFDSADGQVARLRALSSPAGEWLDHFVDAAKASLLPLGLAVGLYRSHSVPVEWLLVPLAASAVSSVLFFTMILTEQLRLRYSSIPLAAGTTTRQTRTGWVRALAVLPMDYGVLCLSFVLLGALPVFVTVYTLILVATTAFLALAARRWFTELRSIDPTEARP